MDTCYHEHRGIVTGSGTPAGADLSLNIPELEFKLGREGMSESSHGKHFTLCCKILKRALSLNMKKVSKLQEGLNTRIALCSTLLS